MPQAPNVDADLVLAQIRTTIDRMDRVMDNAAVAVNQVANAHGADRLQLDRLSAQQAEYWAARVAMRARGGRQEGAPTAKPPKKSKGWLAPQDTATRAKALGDAPPKPLERCWECFPDLPPAKKYADWLGDGAPGEKDRAGQPMKRFLQPGPHRNFPTRRTATIYLLPIGDVSAAPPPAVFCELLKRFFLLDCKVLSAPSATAVAKLERNRIGCGYGEQIETRSAMELLVAHTPKDAFITLGYTTEDICDTVKGFQFLFGQARLDLACGLFSFARYTDGVDAASPTFLRRCGMVLCHEACHLFGIKHCVYTSCLMNGSNHLDESESRPFAACPADLRKLTLTLDQAKLQGRDTPPVDVVARERGLAQFFDAHGLHADARFSRQLVSALTGQAEPEPEAGGESAGGGAV